MFPQFTSGISSIAMFQYWRVASVDENIWGLEVGLWREKPVESGRCPPPCVVLMARHTAQLFWLDRNHSSSDIWIKHRPHVSILFIANLRVEMDLGNGSSLWWWSFLCLNSLTWRVADSLLGATTQKMQAVGRESDEDRVNLPRDLQFWIFHMRWILNLPSASDSEFNHSDHCKFAELSVSSLCECLNVWFSAFSCTLILSKMGSDSSLNSGIC